MSRIKPPPPMKFVVAAFGREAAAVRAATSRLSRALFEAGIGPDLGPADFEAGPLELNETRYYEPEMGPGLVKLYQSFPVLADPDVLVDLKLAAMDIESDSALPGGRTINLDPGYVFEGGLVLSTGKFSGHRLHLGRGVWGELTLHYHRGGFTALPWTYPDYLRPEVLDFLTKARQERAAVLGRGGPKAKARREPELDD